MIEEGTGLKKIHNEYSIENHGPSNVDQMIVTILIPTAFITASNHTVNLVNSSDVILYDSLFNNITIYSGEKHNPNLVLEAETPDFTKMNVTKTSIQSVNNLMKNRTVFMDCSYPQEHFKCDEFTFWINSLAKGDIYKFTVDYSLNMSKFGKIIEL